MRRQVDLGAECHDRIERGPLAAGKASLESPRTAHASVAAQETLAVGLERDEGDRRGICDQPVHHDRKVLIRALRTPREDERIELRDVPPRNEELAEGEVSGVVPGRSEHDLSVAREAERSRSIGLVHDRDASNFDVVGCADCDVRPDGDPVLASVQLHHVGVEHDVECGPLAASWLARHRPGVARLLVTDVDPEPRVVEGSVGNAARDDVFAPAKCAPPGLAYPRCKSAVPKQVNARQGSGLIRAPWQQRNRPFGRGTLQRGERSPRFFDRELAGHSLLKQQARGLHTSIRLEALDPCVFAQEIVDRGEDHALVVGHMGGDDRVVSPLRKSARGEVDRLVEAVASEHSEIAQALEILGRGRREQGKGQRGCVGRDDAILVEPALAPESLYAERAVLIVVIRIEGGESRFRHSPRLASALAFRHLLEHGRSLALGQQRTRVAVHEKRRHQVLEHRAAPGEQGDGALDVGQRAVEREPVLGGDIPFRNGDEAREPRLGREQVVVMRVHLVGGDVVTDEEMSNLGVVEQTEVHLQGLAFRLAGEPGEILLESLRVARTRRDGLLEFVEPRCHLQRGLFACL